MWKIRKFDILLHYATRCINKIQEKWMKGCIVPFFKNGDLGVTKNDKDITLTAIATKVSNALHFNRIRPENE